jgi:hypothetical protein
MATIDMLGLMTERGEVVMIRLDIGNSAYWKWSVIKCNA